MALVEFDNFKDPNEWRHMEEKLRFKLPRHNNTVNGHARAFIQACLPHPHGLDTLLEVLDNSVPEPHEIVCFLLDQLVTDSNMNFSRLREFRTIVDPKEAMALPVEDKEALRIFKLVQPWLPLEVDFEAGRYFIGLAYCLARVSHSNENAPFFVFLEHCRPFIKRTNISNALATWEDEVATCMELDLKLIQAAVHGKLEPAKLKPTAIVLPVLQIKVEPDINMVEGDGPPLDRYKLTAWIHQGASIQPVGEVSPPYLAKDLPAELSKVVDAAARSQLLDGDQMRIETILPRELLETEIECITFKQGFDAQRNPVFSPIGWKWLVTVRSFDRLYDREHYDLAHKAWRRKGMLLAKPINVPQITWTCQSKPYSNKTFLDIGHDRLAFVAFDSMVTISGIVNDFLFSGIPLAVWMKGYRHGALDESDLAKLRDALFSDDPFAWPKKILGWRQCEFCLPDNEQPICSAMMLFWDDVNLLPPDLERPLRGPTQKSL
ncbi:MAG: hypothetical protein JWO94_3751, partial [Verrucomicrobiaceae bacterium]|nr:hypothetical protein [Verrucomicrobiaceae bacterium]